MNKQQMICHLVGLARLQAHRALDFIRLQRSETTGKHISKEKAAHAALVLRCEADGYLKAARAVKEQLKEAIP
jgi:hypothetical protein